MNIRLELLSDTIFGSGMSIPGGEDIAILHDSDGFPYLKAATFKGILREEAENYLNWIQNDPSAPVPGEWLSSRLGRDGINPINSPYSIFISDFTLPAEIREMVHHEYVDPEAIFTSLRTFTQLENGIAKEGSLRVARCINKGFIFYGTLQCHPEDEKLLEDILTCIKWIGSMRTRGFGHVKVSVIPDSSEADK